MKDVITNINVFGLENAICGSKYPMLTDIDKATSEITDRTRALGRSEIGSGHDNYLNGVIAQFDLTFTNKAWVEAERYHFFDFISSQSTMHRITKFDLNSSYIDYVDPRMITVMKELVDRYNETGDLEDYLRVLYSNPCGFKLTAKMTTNYRQLKTMVRQRRDHRLPEWRKFCEQVLDMPHFKELTGLN